MHTDALSHLVRKEYDISCVSLELGNNSVVSWWIKLILQIINVIQIGSVLLKVPGFGFVLLHMTVFRPMICGFICENPFVIVFPQVLKLIFCNSTVTVLQLYNLLSYNCKVYSPAAVQLLFYSCKLLWLYSHCSTAVKLQWLYSHCSTDVKLQWLYSHCSTAVKLLWL
jgi:hypothetical protein